MKTAFVVSCVLAVFVATVSVDGYQDQSRIIGTIRAGDKLLDHTVAKMAPVRGGIAVYAYKYPKWGWGKMISCIRVLDTWYNGTNGDLYLTSGGVGSRSVSMSLQSKIGYGLQYNVEIWGH